MKKFFGGLIVGAVIAFPVGINYGKGVPLWSNPFAAKIEQAKEAVHEATKPAQEKLKR